VQRRDQTYLSIFRDPKMPIILTANQYSQGTINIFLNQREGRHYATWIIVEETLQSDGIVSQYYIFKPHPKIHAE